MTAIADADILAEIDRQRPSGWHHGATVITLRALVIAVCLGLWQVMSGPILPDYAVSKPSQVASSLWDVLSTGAGWASIGTTAYEIMLGFVLGVLLGAVMALLLGTFTLAGRVLEPLVAAVNGIPKIAIAPLFLLFFGIGDWSKITIAITGVAFIVFYNLYLGIRLVKDELVEIVRVMGGRGLHVLRYVTLPSLAAPFFAGLKASGPIAILSVIAGEFIASYEGIGHELFTDANTLDAAGVFAWIIILVAMSLLLNSLLTQLDKLALRKLGLAGGDRRSPTPSR